MKIINYKKKKGNIYEITLSNNNKINLYDDVILKYELLLKKEISEENLKQITIYNSYLESYNIALKYLNIKLRTEKEIEKKLKDFSKEAIDYTINRLKKEGYLNDINYIKAYTNDAINLKLVGQNKISFDLNRLGFEKSQINNYLQTIDENIWLNKINKYIKKKLEVNHNLSANNLKQKIINDLYKRGFYKEDIINILSSYEIKDSDEIKNKEYEKLKIKLSKKYSGKELEERIKLGLLKKGFKD